MSLGGGGGAGVAEWKVSPAVGDHSTYGRCLPPWDGQVPKSGVCCGVTLCPGVCGPLGPANVRGANLSAIEGNVGLESLKRTLCPPAMSRVRYHGSPQAGRFVGGIATTAALGCQHRSLRSFRCNAEGDEATFRGALSYMRARGSSKTLQVSAKACWHSKNLLAGSLKNKWEYIKGTCTFIQTYSYVLAYIYIYIYTHIHIC